MPTPSSSIDELDRWLTELLGGEGAPEGVALAAVGSYGRGDMAPRSDLDVLLLHRGHKDIAAVADGVWYPIWDRGGIRLDHSVRTVREALAVAADDLKVMLGLLDVRFVAGDAGLVEELRAKADELWRSRAKRFLPLLVESCRERWERYGEVAFLLEPDLKEGKGGLRDVHALRAAALATPVLDRPPLDGARDVLARVRARLHERTGRAEERLLLQEQDAVAADLGFGDGDGLMREVSGAARAIAFCADDAWARVESWLAGPRRRGVGRDRPLGPGVLLRDGEVATTEPRAWPRAAATAAELGAPLARSVLAGAGAAGAGATGDVPEPWPEWLRSSVVALLAAGPGALPVLEALDQAGLWSRLFPEWQLVRNKPQRNAYHRYTVDRHLWEAAVEAGRFVRDVARPDLLLLGALLHDIGKGVPGRDHTEAGIELVRVIGPRMGLDATDTAVLEAMVRHHLLLPDVATRRDLDDPATIESVARAVGDPLLLSLLAALTEADSLATGPAAWSDWKAGLVRTLVARVADRVNGKVPPAPPPVDASLADGLHVEGLTCTVVAPDRPGLVSLVTGVLALNRLDVRSAVVGSDGRGRAVDTFEVEPAFGGAVDWDRVRRDLEAALAGALPIESRLADRAREYSSRFRHHASLASPPSVRVDNAATDRATVLEVRAPDGVGVLHRITKALAGAGADVRWARISTLGHEVVDSFYIEKVTDPEALGRIESSVLAALS